MIQALKKLMRILLLCAFVLCGLTAYLHVLTMQQIHGVQEAVDALPATAGMRMITEEFSVSLAKNGLCYIGMGLIRPYEKESAATDTALVPLPLPQGCVPGGDGLISCGEGDNGK